MFFSVESPLFFHRLYVFSNIPQTSKHWMGSKSSKFQGPYGHLDFLPRLRAELYEALAGRAEAHEAQS
jgi:hypothetical protein